MDEAGSIPSGAPIYGMLGDMDNRGFLDGRIVGVGRVPLGFMFVPGSPLVMQRNFQSNIPITQEEAGILTFAGLVNLRDVLAVARDGNPAARSYVLAHAKSYLEDFAARARSAQSHLSTAGPARQGQAAQAGQIGALLEQASHDAEGWVTAGTFPETSMAPIEAILHEIDQITPALRAQLHFTRVKG
jgi:hypothetical protein